MITFSLLLKAPLLRRVGGGHHDCIFERLSTPTHEFLSRQNKYNSTNTYYDRFCVRHVEGGEASPAPGGTKRTARPELADPAEGGGTPKSLITKATIICQTPQTPWPPPLSPRRPRRAPPPQCRIFQASATGSSAAGASSPCR
jgi:hypothetical protein